MAVPEQPEHTRDGVYSSKGKEFTRNTHYIKTRFVAHSRPGTDDHSVEPGRYRLIAAKACPRANRSIIVRNLLGLADVIAIGLPGPTHDADSWTFDLDPGGVDPVVDIHKLKDAYERRFPRYARSITVPSIVEVASGQVVTNDFAQITDDLFF